MEKVLRSVRCRNRIHRHPSPQNSQLGGIASQAVSGAPRPRLILRCFLSPPFSHRYSLLLQHWETSVTLGETLTWEVCPRNCGGCVSRTAALAARVSVPCCNQIWSSRKDIRAGTGWPPCDPSSAIWPPLSYPIFSSVCELFQMKQTDGVWEDRLKLNEKKKSGWHFTRRWKRWEQSGPDSQPPRDHFTSLCLFLHQFPSYFFFSKAFIHSFRFSV